MCFFEELPVQQQNKFAEKPENPKFQEAPQTRRKPLNRDRKDKPDAPKKQKAPWTASKAYVINEAQGDHQESEEESDEQSAAQPEKQQVDPDLLAAQILHLQELHRQATEKKDD
jgi:hypothetical protein